MFHIHCPVCVCIASVYRRLVTHYWKCKSAKKKRTSIPPIWDILPVYHQPSKEGGCFICPWVKNESLVGPQQPQIGGIESSLFLANWHFQ